LVTVTDVSSKHAGLFTEQFMLFFLAIHVQQLQNLHYMNF
jgi:hypothetical protein